MPSAGFRSDRLVIIGVGLIGGSVAMALRQAGLVRHVTGVGRSPANMERARELGVIDEVSTDISAAVKAADTVVLAIPVQQNERVLASLAQSLQPGTLLTDAGSTKQDFVAAVRKLAPAHLGSIVPGHPIAGAEHTGVDAASASLFQGKNVVVTPLPENRPEAIDRVESLWRACGARVMRMTAVHHDSVFQQ